MVDIGIIYGLTGSSQTTWLHENGVHWPMELLPKDIPDSRILCFGYDADVAYFWAPASSNTVANHAENLLGSFLRLRVNTDTVCLTRRAYFYVAAQKIYKLTLSDS